MCLDNRATVAGDGDDSSKRITLEVATTLRPDPSPRIGTETEIFVNGTEVFPAYTVFGEPCKGKPPHLKAS
jgi:hypothetical protein